MLTGLDVRRIEVEQSSVYILPGTRTRVRVVEVRHPDGPACMEAERRDM